MPGKPRMYLLVYLAISYSVVMIAMPVFSKMRTICSISIALKSLVSVTVCAVRAYVLMTNHMHLKNLA